MVTKKYNPGFLTDDELVASFCVRTSEFESIIETLGENTGNSNQHLMVIGPRGSGKTNLMLRVAIESRRNPELSVQVFPVTFAEESYEVSTCGEFWLECLSRLADQAPQPDCASDLGRTCQDLRAMHDDRLLAERCLGALLDFSDRAGKRAAAGGREPQRDVCGHARSGRGVATAKDASDRAADHAAGNRDQPFRGDRPAGSSPVRPLPRDHAAAARRDGMQRSLADGVPASVLRRGRSGLCRFSPAAAPG